MIDEKTLRGSDPQANQSQPSQGREERLRAAFQFLALALGPGTLTTRHDRTTDVRVSEMP